MADQDVIHVADALIKAWFPRQCNSQAWINSEDGKSWLEISLLDAKVAIDAYKEYIGDDLK